jgi:hypothetical protein
MLQTTQVASDAFRLRTDVSNVAVAGSAVATAWAHKPAAAFDKASAAGSACSSGTAWAWALAAVSALASTSSAAASARPLDWAMASAAVSALARTSSEPASKPVSASAAVVSSAIPTPWP